MHGESACAVSSLFFVRGLIWRSGIELFNTAIVMETSSAPVPIPKIYLLDGEKSVVHSRRQAIIDRLDREA